MTLLNDKAAVTTPDPSGAMVRVWDPLVRLFRWSLVAAFTTAYATGEHFERLHIAAGYTVLGLVSFRIVWGFVGTRHARFSDFVYSPAEVIGHLRDMALRRAQRTLGHNPAGGAMVLALLLMLVIAGATGYALTLPEFARSKWMKEVHEVAANVTLGLAALHVVGVFVSSLLHRENLVRAMITGRKRAE